MFNYSLTQHGIYQEKSCPKTNSAFITLSTFVGIKANVVLLGFNSYRKTTEDKIHQNIYVKPK